MPNAAAQFRLTRPAPHRKHPVKVREVDVIYRTVTLADGAVVPLDQWMASC
ncbi:hypothetical protein [Roseisolibacter sp. H3M3-2]|uniref:hypothetical protein n=1 Tax=Roseisolibacter sp. H3M3-2 TaxID=3031323 RepID=UPI0023DB93BE|nr:hypothetical protein [Roseisolibacter sp. H3M3-2]MDF1506436.1 hypothetical protein [Roseisolibacter sp. H3M3-2]